MIKDKNTHGGADACYTKAKMWNTDLKGAVSITPQMKAVMDYLAEYGEMTDEDLQELLNIKKTRAYMLARQMSEGGLIRVEGRGTEKKYKLL